MTKYHKLILCILIALFISSCNAIVSSAPTITPSPNFVSPVLTNTIAPLTTSTLLATKPPTPQKTAVVPTPTWIVGGHPSQSLVFHSPNLVTDGKLQLSVGSFGNHCPHIGALVYFQTMFTNISDEDITLVDFNYPSRKETRNAYGQVYPILTTLDGQEIYPDAYFLQEASINPRSPLISVIPPGVSLMVGEAYRIPKNIGIEDNDSNVTFQPLAPGKYFIKFVYVSIGYNDSWKGIISSNQIEVCVVE